jgi:hypothetical protein
MCTRGVEPSKLCWSLIREARVVLKRALGSSMVSVQVGMAGIRVIPKLLYFHRLFQDVDSVKPDVRHYRYLQFKTYLLVLYAPVD